MKTLLRLIRGAYCHLFAWCDYPTSEQRLRGIYRLGKCQGHKEALKELPITQVQPAVPKIEIKPFNLPPGMWSKLYFEEHPQLRPVIPSQPAYWPEPIESFPAWLNSKPRKSEQEDPLDTTESPAIVALLHQEKNSNGHH